MILTAQDTVGVEPGWAPVDVHLHASGAARRGIAPATVSRRPTVSFLLTGSTLSDLIAAVKKASGDGATLDEMKKKIGDQLAAK